MSTKTTPSLTVRQSLRRAATRARLAPSVHNTQPWRFTITDDSIELDADPSRRLDVLDPTGRQLAISCGCALFNIRAALAADGLIAEVERLAAESATTQYAGGPTGSLVPMARIRVHRASGGHGRAEAEISALDAAVPVRQTNRRRFADDPVPRELLDIVEEAALAESCRTMLLDSEDRRQALAQLSQRADALELADPAYRAEIRSWTSDDPARGDGVPAWVVPHVDAGAQDEVPIRDFDSRGEGWLPTVTHSSRHQCLLLLCTDGDDAASWLRAGEALERIWLEVTRHGFAMSLFTQVIEVPSARAALRREVGLTGMPHIVLRIGRAPATPSSPRRHLAELLVEA